MKSYNNDTDVIMMPSTFRWNAHATTCERDKAIMVYAPLVMKVVNSFKRDDMRVGIFDKHDLIQSGFVGLIEGYDRIIASEGKTNVNYLELNIKGTINRHLNYQATGVAIPEYQLQKTKSEIVADRVISAFFYTFRLDDNSISGVTYGKFSSRIEYVDAMDSYDNELLSEKLSDLMWGLPERDREVLNMSFGITVEKASENKIAKAIDKDVRTVRRIKKRALEELNTLRNALFMKDFL